MSGCEGCFTSSRGQQEHLTEIRSQAKAYAKEIKDTIAIYREGYELRFARAGEAIAGGYNIVEVVSRDH